MQICYQIMEWFETLLSMYLWSSNLNPQSATFRFFQIDPDLVMLLNHILLLYKYYIYSSRDSSKLLFVALLKNIEKVFDRKKNISSGNEKKTKAFIRK